MKLRQKLVEQSVRSHLDEDDERMVDFDPHKTSTFRRRNSPIPGSARNNRAKGLVENGAGWFQVTVSTDFYTNSITKNLPIRNSIGIVKNGVCFSLHSFHTDKNTIKI